MRYWCSVLVSLAILFSGAITEPARSQGGKSIPESERRRPRPAIAKPPQKRRARPWRRHPKAEAAAIRAVIEAQAAAWNRGDLEGYMDGYDRSKDTEFVGGDTITRGWQTVLERYRRNYNSREKMGVLTFSELEITVLSKDAALVLGRWHLKRTSDEPHGTFSLLFRKTKAGWRIVHDHSSSA